MELAGAYLIALVIWLIAGLILGIGFTCLAALFLAPPITPGERSYYRGED